MLVVDDDSLVQELLTEYLVSDGHLVESVASGLGALRRFELAPFDLVISDLSMPEMPGDKLAAALERLSPELPIILTTGFASAAGAGVDLDAVDAVLEKPLTIDTLRHALASVLRETPFLIHASRQNP